MNNQKEMNEAKLVAFIDGSLSPEEMAEVEHWYDASDENRKTLEQLYFVLQLHDRCNAVKDVNPERALAALKQKIAQRSAAKRRRSFMTLGRRVMRYAAIVLLLAGVAGLGAYIYYDKNQYCEIVADNSQNKTIVLPDQSTVTLKADSKISFPAKFTEERVVYLDGEALFDVAKRKGAEFVVKAKGAQICVKGTKFNFKAYSACPKIEATLIEGAVDFRTNGHKVAIKPNQKVVYNAESRRMNIVEVDARLDIFGERYFDMEKLGYVINSLEHIYDCKISFADNRIEDIRFTGTVNRNNSLEHTLNIITLTTGTEYKRYGDAVVISK
ncbi:MAG: DUF4974 domain-containing protein [Alistipes sp.]|nr:DUF4974 domain-containing protein [Alistipes sp.]